MTLKVEWVDSGREPKCDPNPAYPTGVDIRIPPTREWHREDRRCSIALPYPAKRCGLYVVNCSTCGMQMGITTAGRADDPRSVSVCCDEKLQ